MFVALAIHYAIRMRYIVVYNLYGSTIFPYLISQKARLSKIQLTLKLLLIFFTDFASEHSHAKKKWEGYDQKFIPIIMYSTRYSCQILMKLDLIRQSFEKYSNVKFNENTFSGSRAFMWTDGQRKGQTDMMKPIVVFRKFARST